MKPQVFFCFILSFFYLSPCVFAQEFDQKSQKRLIKIIKKRASKKAWQHIEKLGPKSESPQVISCLIDRALEDADSQDPHIFYSSWNVLNDYQSTSSHAAIVKKLSETKNDKDAVFILSLLNRSFDELTQEQKDLHVKEIKKRTKSSHWPCQLAAVKASGCFVDDRLGQRLIDVIAEKRIRLRTTVEAKKIMREFYKGSPTVQDTKQQWVKWWIDYLKSKKREIPQHLKEYNTIETVVTSSHKKHPIENINYFGHKIESDHFVLITDYSRSMEPAVTVDAKIKKLKHAYLDDVDDKIALKHVKKTLSSKHEYVLRKQIELIALMPEQRKFNLVFFGSGLNIYKPIKNLVQATLKNKEEAINFVLKSPLSPATQIYEGIEKAVENKQVDTFYLLTDGKPYNSKQMDKEVIKRACHRWSTMQQIVFHTIDLGMIPDVFSRGRRGASKLRRHDYVKDIANVSGGTYQYFENLKDVELWIPDDEPHQ